MKCLFRRKIFGFPIKTKSRKELIPNITKLLKVTGKFVTLASDGEAEYLRPYFNEMNISLRTAPRGKHMNLIENSIRVVKRKIFFYLRSVKTTKWTDFFPRALQLINNHQNPALGYLKPDQVDGKADGDNLIFLRTAHKHQVNSLESQQGYEKKFVADKKNIYFLPGKKVLVAFPKLPYEKEVTAKVRNSNRILKCLEYIYTMANCLH